MAKLFSSFFPSTLRYIHLYRIQADPSDNFASLWRKLFKDIHIQVQKKEGSETIAIAELYENKSIMPDDVRRELSGVFSANHVPIVVVDEYDKVRAQETHVLMANTLKALSDEGVNVTVVLVGVADNINELVGEHSSIVRCVEQVPMPRMNATECKEILDKIVPRLGIEMDPDALWKIVNLSRGMPSYVHALGLYSVQSAISRKSLFVTEKDADVAIARALERVEESFRDTYSKAVHSNRRDNLYSEVLLACALAETDERGTFTPLAVCKPLGSILKRDKEIEIAAFQQHLAKFITPERANVLVQRGRPRAFRYRFDDPMMQPY